MTDSEQITLYSCHLCGFCETSLSALTKHTASHIKTERPPELVTSSSVGIRREVSKESWKRMSFDSQSQRENDSRTLVERNSSGIVLIDRQPRDEDGENPAMSFEMRQRQDGASDSERGRSLITGSIIDDDEDDDVIVLEENIRSPQIGDVFPSNSYPVTTQSRVIFPSGWSEPRQSSTTIRMPNDPYRNTHQTRTVSVQEKSQEARLPQIVNCSTVRSSSGHRGFTTRRVDLSIEEMYPASSRRENSGHSSIHNDNSIQIYQEDSNSERRSLDSRSSGSISKQQNSSYPSSSSFVQYPFNRPKDPQMNQNNIHHHSQSRSRASNHETTDHDHNRSHYSAFSSFSSHKNNYRPNNEIFYRQDSPRSSTHSQIDLQRYHNDGSRYLHGRHQHDYRPMSPDNLMFSSGLNNIACPIPLPNNGAFIPNHGHPIVLPSSLNRADVSGFVIIPIKKTNEIAVQTDESCLSKEYLQYRPQEPRNTGPSNVQEMHAVGRNFEKDQSIAIGNLHGTQAISRVNCHVCNKEFMNAEKLKAHFDKVHCTESLNCRDCGRNFQSAKNMQLHRARVHNKKMPFRCGVCGLRFEDRSSVVQHLTTHNANEKTFNCSTCGKKFRSEENLKKHMTKHKDMWHKCVECYKSFGSVATLQYHIAQVHKRQQQTDNESGVTTVLQDGRHESRALRVETAVSLPNISVEQPLVTCQYCQATFTDSDELSKHSAECSLAPAKSSKKMFRCAACPTFFTNKSELISHYNTNHLTSDGYVCSKCPRKFRLWSKLKIHIKNFHGLKKTVLPKFQCKACPSKFSSRLKLDDHMRKVHQIPVKHERIYTCKECKKRFRNLSSLMVHRRGVHALNILESPSTQTWECPHCNIDRLTRKTYIAHLKEVHKLLVAEKGRSLEIIGQDTDGGESHEFGEEGKTVSINGTVVLKDGTSSEAVTSGFELTQKKFNCQECGAEFDEEKRLKNHLGLVHGRKPFSCEICDRKFSYSGQLTWHMKEHEDRISGRKDSNEKPGMSSVVSNVSVANDIASRHQDAGDGMQKQTKSSPSQNFMLSCSHCGMKFADEKRLNNHLGVRHGYKNFACDICDQRFSYSTHLIWHKRSHFADKNKEAANKITDGEENLMNDQTNDKLMADEVEPGNEVMEMNGDNTMKCNYCEQIFQDEESLESHIKMHDSEAEMESQFDSCKEQLETNKNAEQHSKELEPGPSNTSESDKSFSVADKEPTKTHDEKENQNVCSQCDEEFNDSDLLQDHMMKSHDVDHVSQPQSHDADHVTQLPDTDHVIESNDAEVLNSDTKNKKEAGTANTENHLPNNGFNCEICNKLLGTYIGWKVHRTRVHRLSDDKTEAQAAAFSYALQNYPAPVPQELDADYAKQRELGSEDLNSSAVFSCSKCSRIFTGLRNLRTHQYKMHSIRIKEKSSKEPEAPETEPSETPLFASKVKENDVFPCGTCDYRFSSEKGRKIHCKKMMHSEYAMPDNQGHEPDNITNKHPSQGGKSTSNKIARRGKYITDSPSLKKAKFDEDTDAVISPCEICNIEFKSFQELRLHFQEKHPEEISFQTPNKDFVSKSSWDLEVGGQVNSKSAPAALGIELGCPKCDRTFPTRKGLNTHLVKFHKVKGASFARWMQKSGDDDNIQDGAYSESTNELQSTPGVTSANSIGYESRSGGASGNFMPTMVDSLNDSVDQNVASRRACSICQRSFHNRRGLTMHMARFHHLNKAELRKFNIDLDLIAESEMLTDNFSVEKPVKAVERSPALTEPCPLCPLKFPSRRSLGTHIFKRHGIRCKRLSPAERRSLFSLNKHNAPESYQVSSAKDTLIAIDCPICTGKFVGKRGVRAHVSRIHGLDKIELGYLFPEKYQTEDAVTKTCNHCERVFSNIRIYAAHLYFVHKIEKDDSMLSENAEHIYRCSDLKCDETFNNALDLLMHVRARNGRGIDDINVEVINPDPSSTDLSGIETDGIIDDDDDYGDDGDMIVDVDALGDDRNDIDYEGIENENKTREKSHRLDSPEPLPCFLCKQQFTDEDSFRIHYEKAHGGMNASDAENLRDLIERSRLQTDAVSKEYSLRATASRKAFRSEIEYTENFLNSPKPVKETSIIEPEVAFAFGESQLEEEAMTAVENGNCSERGQDDETREQTENNQSEASKKNFFAAALNLRVTP